METNYHTEYFVDDKSTLFILLLLIICAFIFVILFLVLKLRKRMDKILTILTDENKYLANKQQYVNSKNNLNKHLVNQTIEDHTSAKHSNEQKEELLFNKFKKWIEEEKHYLKPNFDLNWAARELGTNRSYLSKSINSQGFGFSEYINKLRIKKAVEKLENENDNNKNSSLKEIALEVGFQAKSVFNNSFQKETGMTPTQFKEYLKNTKL